MRSTNALRKRVSHFLLRIFAFFIIEPRVISGRWRIRDNAKSLLKPHLLELFSQYENAGNFFKTNKTCLRCPGGQTACCGGSYTRFDVYDHLGQIIADVDSPIAWGYRLYPFGSYKKNACSLGVCHFLVVGEGCSLKYKLRPGICVYSVCDKAAYNLTKEQKEFLERLNFQINRVRWKMVFSLILSGLEKVNK